MEERGKRLILRQEFLTQVDTVKVLTEMPKRFSALPLALLDKLGCVHDRAALEPALAKLDMPTANLCHLRGGAAYPVSPPGKGLDLMLQCINPQAPESELRWGLHAMTLHTARSDPARYWREPWPDGIHADTATAGDAVSLLAEDEDDGVLMIDTMACFEVPGFDALPSFLPTRSHIRLGPMFHPL